MDKLLRPGGRMLHKIGLGDYDMFSGIGYGPLEFLTIPETVWSRMASHAGRPTAAGEFLRRHYEKAAVSTQIHIVELAGRREPAGPGRFCLDSIPAALQEELARYRPRLAAPFRALSDEELLVEDLFDGYQSDVAGS
jgi:hypothetical protein